MRLEGDALVHSRRRAPRGREPLQAGAWEGRLQVKCPRCKGGGFLAGTECPRCEGAGEVEEVDIAGLDVEVPAPREFDIQATMRPTQRAIGVVAAAKTVNALRIDGVPFRCVVIVDAATGEDVSLELREQIADVVHELAD